MTVEEMLGRMSSREFVTWQVFNSISPIGSLRGDMQAARTAHTVAEVNRDTKKRARPYGLLDFMPDPWETLRPKRTAAQIEAEMRMAFGG